MKEGKRNHRFMTNSAFMQDSNELKNVLLKEASRLSDEIDELERRSGDHIAYYAYLKDFLINSGVLCDDILQAFHNDVVLLGMVGTRALLEDTINVHYLESKTNQAERMSVAIDWFRLSNDAKAYKNKLDNKPVSQRAKDAGKDTESMHDSEYTDFCNYTHSTAQRSILNIPAQRTLIANKAALASLKAYANIVTCVSRITGNRIPQSKSDMVTQYLDKYSVSVMQATLPVLDII